MKIAVVAANGKAGQLIVKEALDRGHDVTAIVRGANKSVASNVIAKDAFDLTAEDLAGFEVVIDAVGVWTPDTLPQIAKAAGHLADLLSCTDIRLLVVGGAGGLYMDETHTIALEDTPAFPDAYKPVSAAHGDALNLLRERSDVKWTYISPAADFQAEGDRTGSYELAGEEFTTNSEGRSFISYADYAIAMVDEAESGAHAGQRISVYTK